MHFIFGASKYCTKQVYFGRTKQGKGATSIPDKLLLFYFAKGNLIQLMWSGTMRAFTKLVGYTGLVVYMTFWWLMAGYMM